MKARINIRSIILVMAIIGLASMFFINICFATSTGKIITETARLREETNTDSKVLELASYGDNVEILEELDGWYKVKYKNITGYIRNDLISVENKVDTNTINDEKNNETNESQPIVNNTVEETIQSNNIVNEEETLQNGKYELAYDVKIRIVPLISAIELSEVKQGTEVEVIEVLNNWAKIKTQDGIEGWVLRRWNTKAGGIVVLFYLPKTTENNNQSSTEKEPEQTTNVAETKPSTINKTMYVNSQTINLREEPNTASKVLKQLSLNQEVIVTESENGWYKVQINGTIGYISQSLLSDTKKETSRSATTERQTTQNTSNVNSETVKNENTSNKTIDTTPQTDTGSNSTEGTANSNTGNDIVAYAKQFLGCKYVYGGTTTNGFDCSGFTQYVYKHFGINLNRTAAAQYSNGTAVTNLQAGDLVMFGKTGINHVGIYIGGNTFIHAANPSRGVTTDTLASGYYKINYVGARRII